MLNRLATSVLRKTTFMRQVALIHAEGARRRGTVYSPITGEIVAWNFGTSVRPEVALVSVTNYGDETVESFLARGGRITTCEPKIATGALLVTTVNPKPSRVRVSRG